MRRMVASATLSVFSRVCPLATTMPSSVAAAMSMPSMPVMGEMIPRSRCAEVRSALEAVETRRHDGDIRVNQTCIGAMEGSGILKERNPMADPAQPFRDVL